MGKFEFELNSNSNSKPKQAITHQTSRPNSLSLFPFPLSLLTPRATAHSAQPIIARSLFFPFPSLTGGSHLSVVFLLQPHSLFSSAFPHTPDAAPRPWIPALFPFHKPRESPNGLPRQPSTARPCSSPRELAHEPAPCTTRGPPHLTAARCAELMN